MKRNIWILFVFILTACSTPISPSSTETTNPPPTATQVPTATSAPSPTITPSPTPLPDGPCDNPLVYLAPGNQWRYRAITNHGEFNYFLNTLERNDAANIVINVEFGNQERGDIVREPVVCVDGAIDNFPLFLLDMHFSGYLDHLFDTYHERGVYVPGAETFVESNWQTEWLTEYLTEDKFNVKNPMGVSDLWVLQSSPIRLTFRTDGSREGVTVPAGDFPEAIKVTNSISMIVTLTLPTGGAGGTLILDTTQWYQPYVGLVRSEVNSAWIETGGQQFSAPFQSVIELVEFTPGQ